MSYTFRSALVGVTTGDMPFVALVARVFDQAQGVVLGAAGVVAWEEH